jgi:outer membrane immunogenic protein
LFTLGDRVGTLEYLSSTFRTRIGHTFPLPWEGRQSGLLYATGGLAFGRVEATIADIATGTTSDTHTRVGWTVGTGIEFPMFDKKLTAKAEYRFTHYDEQAYFQQGPLINFNFRSNVPLDTNKFLFGMNYRLWP